VPLTAPKEVKKSDKDNQENEKKKLDDEK